MIGLRWRLCMLGMSLIIPTLLVLGGVRLLMTPAYVSVAYRVPGFPADPYGFSLEDRLHYAPYAVDYLVNNAPLSYLGDLRLPNGSAVFNERELKHMDDVQVVVRWSMAALVGLSLVFVCALLLSLRSPLGRRALRQALITGGALILIALLLLVIYILIDWDHFFDSFHNLFFAQGTWQFRYSDSLIRLFPIFFWQNAALTLGAISAGGGIICLCGGIIWGRRARHQGGNQG
ncbi:MAG: TIGR01906 family membrane protein [Anaerolinea sp.]|nr:TIGR01906 family membrane protein [Anaerolinea sp.]MCC6973005.1 TIGR01906 family membrane protein [Anaerolineae bacterium]